MTAGFGVCSTGLVLPLFSKTGKAEERKNIGEDGIKSSVLSIRNLRCLFDFQIYL